MDLSAGWKKKLTGSKGQERRASLKGVRGPRCASLLIPHLILKIPLGSDLSPNPIGFDAIFRTPRPDAQRKERHTNTETLDTRHNTERRACGGGEGRRTSRHYRKGNGRAGAPAPAWRISQPQTPPPPAPDRSHTDTQRR